MPCWSEFGALPPGRGAVAPRLGVARPGVAVLGLAVLGLALPACSGEEGGGDRLGATGAPGSGAGFVATLPPVDPAPGVSNYDRPLGMPIGRGAADPEAGGLAPAAPDDEAAGLEGFELPALEPSEKAPPCSGCVELSLLVNDINQRAVFAFDAGGVEVTRVVWTIIVPFNSDQLFVQPYVDNSYGTYTDLDANAFAPDTPVELVHEYSGTASAVGMAVGSSGAWTGNMTLSVFIDAVLLEGADPSASRTFDTDAQGFRAGFNAQNPQIVYHP